MFLFLWRILGVVGLACLAAVIHRSLIDEAPEVVFVREPATGQASGATAKPLTTPGTGTPVATPQTPVVALISADQAFALYENEAVQFIDARNKDDFEAGHLPLAAHLPLSSFAMGFPEAVNELIPEVTTIVYCEGGNCESSLLVARQLVAAGFESVMVLEEGFPGWIAEDYPIEHVNNSEGQ